MTPLYLNQDSISHLAQFILSLVMTLYLCSLDSKATTQKLFTLFFVSITVFTGVLFLSTALISVWRFYIVHMQIITVSITVTCLIQFAYRFPSTATNNQPLSYQHRESEIALIFSSIVILSGVFWALYQSWLFSLRYRATTNTVVIDIFVALQFLWLFTIFLRRIHYFSNLNTASNTATWFKNFLKPQGQAARASRAFALAFLLSLAISFILTLGEINSNLLLTSTKSMMVNLGVLFNIFIVSVVYFNYTTESSTFMAKLIGISLVTILSILGTVGIIVIPFYEANYHHQDLEGRQRSFRFEPASEGYTLTEIPFQFKEDIGDRWINHQTDDPKTPLPFPFPFYGQTWSEMYLYGGGIITFGRGYNIYTLRGNHVPAITPFATSKNYLLFIKSEKDALTLTWSDSLEAITNNAFQLILYADGTIEVNHQKISAQPALRFGIQAGTGEANVTQISLADSFSNQHFTTQGIIANLEANYRQYLHQQLIPLAFLLIAATLFILIGFPIFFYITLIQPLNNLVQGVKAVNMGDLHIKIPMQYNDEIGFLTESFNGMVRSIGAANKLKHELSIAQDIQESLLPLSKPAWPDLDVICYNTPARDIGGDFYQYHRFETFNVDTWWAGISPDEPNPLAKHKGALQKYAFVVGDVSGKGVSAALLMATSLSQFDASLAFELTPTERLIHLDKAISPYTKPRRKNCAMCYVELVLPPKDKDRAGQIYMINAACIPPYIKRASGQVEQPNIGGFALGQDLGNETSYQGVTLPIYSGDLIILTSDGLIEANNAAGDMLGFERFAEIIQNGPQTNVEAMLSHIKGCILTFTGKAEQRDDMTVVVIQV